MGLDGCWFLVAGVSTFLVAALPEQPMNGPETQKPRNPETSETKKQQNPENSIK